jgi:arsenical pump membrane protein
VVPNRAYFLASVTILVVVLVGYFLAPIMGLEPSVIEFAGSGVLVIAGAATGRVRFRTAGELSWDLFPFVVGLIVAVQGLEDLGVVGVASEWLAHMKPGSPENLLATAGATTLASNIMNNLPAALIARGVLLGSHAHTGTILAALVGADVGPMITPFGSLATMLVLALARREGAEVPIREFVTLGLWAAPLIVVVTVFALALGTALAASRVSSRSEAL